MGFLNVEQQRIALQSYLGSWMSLFDAKDYPNLPRIPLVPRLIMPVMDITESRRVITFLMVRAGRQNFRVLTSADIREIQFERHDFYEGISDLNGIPYLVIVYGLDVRSSDYDEHLICQVLHGRMNPRLKTVLLMIRGNRTISEHAHALDYHSHLLTSLRPAPLREDPELMLTGSPPLENAAYATSDF